jgi:Ribbon-helix-helix protein, copG family
MPLSVRLDRATEAKVRQLARARRVSKSTVVREALAAYGNEGDRSARPTPAEALAPFVGVVAGGDPHRSTRTGEGFRALIAQKARARRSR